MVKKAKFVLVFDDEVVKQTNTTDFKNEFDSERKAYAFLCSRWGSGLFGRYIRISKKR